MSTVLDREKLLALPEVVDVEVAKKLDFATAPDVSQLTPDQKVIFDEVMSLVNGTKSGIYVMKGYAGTGKTFLTSIIMEYILSTTSLSVAVTAPTNKAVKVARKQSKFSSEVLNLCYSTIHSMLGLKEKIDGYGRQTFVKLRDQDVSVDQYQVIFIDEASMMADELLEELLRYLPMYNLKLIFIGDPIQIPPVGEDDFALFKEEGISFHGAGVGELTQVLRQAADNPIIALTMKIRNAIGRSEIIPIRNDSYDEETMDGLYFLGPDDKTLFYDILRKYFVSDNFKKDADFMKIIAWTNKTVGTFNKIVRKMIYGEVETIICIGEKLIANKPIIDDNDKKIIIFNNSDEFEVVDYSISSGTYKGVDFNYYNTKVFHEEKGERTIKIIHESSQDDYDLVIDHLVSLAKGAKQGSYEAAGKWADFFAFQNIFADVNYNYAITCHKAQGSSYDNVVVLESDLDANRKIVERNRIKYTAFTRPRKKLFIVN